MKPDTQQIAKAVAKLGVLRFFPTDSAARVAVMEMLSRMVSEAKQLDWLVATMVDRVGEWRGTAELRGVFCTRYKPADGIEANVSPDCPLYQTAEQCEERERLQVSTAPSDYQQLTERNRNNSLIRLNGDMSTRMIEAPVSITPEEAAVNRDFASGLVAGMATAVKPIPEARRESEITQDDIDRAVQEYRAAKRRSA